ncbi:Gibberellin 2-beta-dioxygenase 6 [Linum grandiflorum]
MNDSDVRQRSYPPAFRRQQTTTTTTTTQPTSPPPVAAPPTIDLENPDMEILREACKEWGVFRVVNHGVPISLIRRLKSYAREFFHQPFEEKVAAADGGDGGNSTTSYSWGTPVLSSSGRPVERKEVNWFEGVNFSGLKAGSSSGSDLEPVAERDLFGGLRTAVEEYGEHLGRIAKKIVEAMGELLGVEDCGAYVSEPTGIVRVYRYPQTPAHHDQTAAPPLGMQPHTDSSLVSILLEDDKVSGLQIIKDDDVDAVDDSGDDNNWLTIQPVPETLLINIGDMIKAISNDEFKSVKHRVKVKSQSATNTKQTSLLNKNKTQMNDDDRHLQLSYPPVFRRQQTTTITTTEPTSPPPDQVAAPPVIDLENPDMEILRGACKEWGVFRVVNHGVPSSLIRQLKSHATHFFLQPFESKLAAGSSMTNSSYFWGTPALTSSGRPVERKEINWVEGVNFSGLLLSPAASDPLFPSLRTLVEEYGEHAGRIAKKIVEAMGELLGVEDCGAYVSESTGIVRVYRYPQTPAQHQMEAPPLGMQAHTDSSLVSIVLEDDKVSGLQFIKEDNTAVVAGSDDAATWLTFQPIPDTLLINIGDMIQAISNDEFKSVKHRVKIGKGDEDRISICYFVFPKEDKIIETSIYKPFTFQEFHQQVLEDIKTLGVKVGLERFKRAT